jgi:hypothetical protein
VANRTHFTSDGRQLTRVRRENPDRVELMVTNPTPPVAPPVAANSDPRTDRYKRGQAVKFVLGDKEHALGPGESVTVKRAQATKAAYAEGGDASPLHFRETLRERKEK